MSYERISLPVSGNSHSTSVYKKKKTVIKFTLGNELIEIWYKLVQAFRLRHEAYFFGFQNGVNVSKKRTDRSPVVGR